MINFTEPKTPRIQAEDVDFEFLLLSILLDPFTLDD